MGHKILNEHHSSDYAHPYFTDYLIHYFYNSKLHVTAKNRLIVDLESTPKDYYYEYLQLGRMSNWHFNH